MTSSEAPTPVDITLDGDAALVLFELLARFEKTDALTIDDPAEGHALTLLQGRLEKALVPPFRADYGELLNDARARLRKHFG